MKLEEQVCSLELSKKLKELGIKRESLFYWLIDERAGDKKEISQLQLAKHRFDGTIFFTNWHEDEYKPKEMLSAFTVAELGEMLLATGCHFDFTGNIGVSQVWCCHKYNGNVSTKVVNDIREADCRAKMLIWCIENGTVTL